MVNSDRDSPPYPTPPLTSRQGKRFPGNGLGAIAVSADSHLGFDESQEMRSDLHEDKLFMVIQAILELNIAKECSTNIMPTTAITDAITTLAEAEQRFRLYRSEEDNFFPEWQIAFPALTDLDRTHLDQLRQRYLYQRASSHLLEATVMLLFASPLLSIAGFFDPPFKVRSEESVQLILDDSETILQGRIDVLVLQNQLWIVVLESKKTALSVWTALPKTLAYLMANPQPTLPSFAMITNGDAIIFVKLSQKEERWYGISRVFSPFVSYQEIYTVLQILKSIAQEASPQESISIS